MKSKFVLLSIPLGLFLALDVEAQRRKKQTTQPKQTTSQTAETSPSTPREQQTATSANSARQQVAKDYKEGETYSLADVVNLNAEGNRLSVELVTAKDVAESKNSIEVKVKISGKLQHLVFTFGQEDSNITLVADNKRIPVSEAYFADEVVASSNEGEVMLSARAKGQKGTVVLNSNQHPLVLQFEIPDELTNV